jgi:hypothetical protein
VHLDSDRSEKDGETCGGVGAMEDLDCHLGESDIEWSAEERHSREEFLSARASLGCVSVLSENPEILSQELSTADL